MSPLLAFVLGFVLAMGLGILLLIGLALWASVEDDKVAEKYGLDHLTEWDAEWIAKAEKREKTRERVRGLLTVLDGGVHRARSPEHSEKP